MSRVLVVDDEQTVRDVLAGFLNRWNHEVSVVANGQEALGKLDQSKFDLMLLDLNMPGMDGLEVLKRARQLSGSLGVILISGSLTVQDTVEAMKHGAFNCLTKPVDFQELERSVNQVLSGTMLHKEIRCDGIPRCAMVVASPAMQQVADMVLKVSRSPASTVLIMGETGTGKEVVARQLHHLSSRRNANFVAVNCAAIPASLIESELFGHERGAFTDAKGIKKGLFEEAHGGTLFLDEVGELPMNMQATLLRALQDKAIRRVGGTRNIDVDVRILAATNVDLRKAISQGKFREDLFYRLTVIPLIVPPLRERKDDILALAEYFLAEFAREFGKPTPSLSNEDKMALQTYAWPGNVRELRNCIERAMLLDQMPIRPQLNLPTGVIEAIPEPVAVTERPVQADKNGSVTLSLTDPTLENAERALILEVMARVHGNRNQAASILGINRTTLYRKLISFGVECVEEAQAPREN